MSTERTPSPHALSERAYRAITKLIKERELRGGEQIVEQPLAERLEISRTPLREALQRLEGEGLLSKNSGRSYIVRKVDLTEYLQSLKTRDILEGEAAALATGRIPEEEIAAVRAEIVELRSRTSYHTNAHWSSDDNVHNLFARHCGNQVMERMIGELRTTTRLFEIAGLASRVDPDSEEHLAIVEALQAGDAARARRAVKSHIRSLMKYSLSDLN